MRITKITSDSVKGSRVSNLDGIFLLQKETVNFFAVIDGFSITPLSESSSELNFDMKQEKLIEQFLKYLKAICSYAENVKDLESLIYYLKNKQHLYERKFSKLQLKASLILGCISDNMLSIVHLGDCRLYVNYKLFTSDDSVAWKRTKKIFSNKDLGFIGSCCTKHSKKQYLTKSFPKNLNDIKFISQYRLEPNDSIIICTDGFWNLHHNDIIHNHLILKKNYIDNSTYIKLIVE